MKHWVEKACLCEMSVHIYQATWDHIPKDSNLYYHIMGKYVCMYVRMCICTYISTHTRTHAHTYISQYNLATSLPYTPKTTNQCAMINAVLQIQ